MSECACAWRACGVWSESMGEGGSVVSAGRELGGWMSVVGACECVVMRCDRGGE